MVETIYIARHGYRLNWDTTIWKSETGLPRDPPLAAYGVSQAEELAQHFLSLPEDERPTIIFSSPYYRCLQTARPVSKALGLPIYVEHGLSEWYSPTNLGHPFITLHEKEKTWMSVMTELEIFFMPCHAATTIALTRELLGDRNIPLRVGCCSITEVKKKPDASTVLAGWEPKRLACGAHLKEGATRDWGFEDIVIADGKVVADPGQPGTEHEQDHPVGLQLSEHEVVARM
ncbi:Histidine phosphatase superfamily protein [Abortiporus biennis]